MKPKTFWIWSLGLALAALPLAGGGDQESANSAPALTSDTSQSSFADIGGLTNAPSPEAAEQQLENASGQVVSAAKTAPQNVNLTGPSAEVVKLAQAGVDESVMLSFVTNSHSTFNLSSDAIIYLNDVGVPGTVVTSMIQHDQALKAGYANVTSPPVYTNPSMPAPGTATPYPGPVSESQPPAEVVENGQPSAPAAGSANYFYDSMAPYGSWISVDGYGLCWQPTTVVVNPGWRPYCNGGNWVYSDSGWYWASDYSWGWAPFHYGRWFRHSRWGWCWAPDTVWGPAWVSWRYNRDFCGWAPLPPTACFRPGFGFTYFGRPVGLDFSFGLSVRDFPFVPINFLCDRHVSRHFVAERQVRGFFNHTVVGRGVLDNHRTFVNAGIPPSRVTAVTHTEIHRMHIREATGPAGGRFDRVDPAGRNLTVFRPNLPAPTHQTAFVGQEVRPDGHHGTISHAVRDEPLPGFRNDPLPGANKPFLGKNAPLPGFKNEPLPGKNAPLPGFKNDPFPGRNQPLPGFKNEPFPAARRGVVGNEAVRNNPPAGVQTPPAGSKAPLILRGPGTVRSQAPVPWMTQPAAPSQSTPAAQNGPRAVFNENRQFGTPVVRSESPPPVQTQPRQQNGPVSRQEAPRSVQQDHRVFTQPAAPVQQHPASRNYQGTAPSPERSLPSPRSQSSAPAPRMETRQAPAASHTAPGSSKSLDQDNNGRRNNR